MLKRNLFFLYERLQITATERKFLYVFSCILLVATCIKPFVNPSTAFDEITYSPVLLAFEARTSQLNEIRQQQIAQYYPDNSVELDTKPDREAFPKPVVVTDKPENPISEKQIATSDKPVNINTADAKELTSLPGIGPAIAARIVEYRNEFGPFKTKEDIIKVRGIGPARFEAIKELITIKDEN